MYQTIFTTYTHALCFSLSHKAKSQFTHSTTMSMTTSLLLFLALLFLSPTHGLNPNRVIPDEGSTLQVLHFSSFDRQDPLSWEARVVQTQSKDEARLQYLASLVAGKSVVLTASARPNYVVKANIGTPPQTVVMALDNSNDAAWIPCAGCVGCSKPLFDSSKSTTFKALGCQAAQCKQVRISCSVH